MLSYRDKIEGLHTVELTNIIRSLLKFIVIESKDYIVEETARKEYIKSYLYLISKSINDASPTINMQTIHDQIEEDLILIFKN